MAAVPGPRPDRPFPPPGIPAEPERERAEPEEDQRASPDDAPEWMPERYDPDREYAEEPIAVP